VIVGDLNASRRSRTAGGEHLRRIIAAGWTLATPDAEPSYFSAKTRATLDHLLHTRAIRATNTRFVSTAGKYILAGARDALSDHAAIVGELQT
jgi:hypothetical protein